MTTPVDVGLRTTWSGGGERNGKRTAHSAIASLNNRGSFFSTVVV
jgi:hypothetical protein